MLRKGPTSLLEVGPFVYSLRMDHMVHSIEISIFSILDPWMITLRLNKMH